MTMLGADVDLEELAKITRKQIKLYTRRVGCLK